MTDRLYRSETDKILGGVCGGLAEHFNADPTLVRLLVIFIELITAGSALLLYLIAWLIIPRESEVRGRETNGTTETSSSTEETARNDLDYESPETEENEKTGSGEYEDKNEKQD